MAPSHNYFLTMPYDPTASIAHDYVPMFDDPYLQMAYDGVKVRNEVFHVSRKSAGSEVGF